jgi:hypothetical protein
MGWERRQGRLYFYKSVRIGGRPRKIYLGKGAAAETQAARVDQAQKQRQAERDALRTEQVRLAPTEAALDDLRAAADLLTRAALLAVGYHLHKGEWRKRRRRHARPDDHGAG